METGFVDCDVLIVGAGAAGLSAAQCLERAGLSIKCLEARDRAGGRILTVRDPLASVPIELGAEFVHGRPPEIWDLVRRVPLTIYKRSGRVRDDPGQQEAVDKILSDLESAAAAGEDRSFADFLEHSSYPEDHKRWATSYVEGFNAARKEVIGIASLAKDKAAADQIDGDQGFAILNGYDSLVPALLNGLRNVNDTLLFGTIVERVQWKPGSVTVHVRSAIDGSRYALQSRRAVITVPLGVLQAEPDEQGAIRFDPEPADILNAARSLAFGQVFRVTLRFDKPFWEEVPMFADASFLLSREQPFPTWWTTAPISAPIITGWSAGPSADELMDRPREEVMRKAIDCLRRILKLPSTGVRAAYVHDWQADPLTRGAYSYVPAGSMAARQVLSQPVSGTLYFAGEATETSGHSATVHGAIRSGLRAAQQILAY